MTIWTIIGLYLGLIVLLHIPAIQAVIGSRAAHVIEEKLSTKVEIGKVYLGLFNRLIIDDVLIFDQSGKKMLQASRLSAKVDLIPLISDGKIRISSAQLFGLKAILYKPTADTKPNFQFALDSLASKDTTSHTPLDLQIQSLVIRNGTISYDQLDAPRSATFNPRHLSFDNISTHLMLHTLTDDSLALNVKKISAKEQSGMELKALSFEVNAGRKGTQVNDIWLDLPDSRIRINNITAAYRFNKDGTLDRNSLRYQIQVDRSEITPSDLSFLKQELKNATGTIAMQTELSGTSNSINVNSIRIHDTNGKIGLKGSGHLRDINTVPKWSLNFSDMKLSSEGIQFLAKNLNGKRVNIPDEVIRLGNIFFKGNAYGQGRVVSGRGTIRTDAGEATFDISLNDRSFKGDIKTSGVELGHILDNKALGKVIADIKLKGTTATASKATIPFDDIDVRGKVSWFDYNGYSYKNIDVDGKYSDKTFNGNFSINDPHGQVDLKGMVRLAPVLSTNIIAKVDHFNPRELKVTDALGDRTFSFEAKANFSGTNISDVNGTLDIQNLNVSGSDGTWHLNAASLESGSRGKKRFTNVACDYLDAYIEGSYDYMSIPQSFANLVGSKLHALPGLPRHQYATNNDFNISLNIKDSQWLRTLLKLPVDMQRPVWLEGTLNDHARQVDMTLGFPDVTYDSYHLTEGLLRLNTVGDTLCLNTSLNKVSDNGKPLALKLNAKAINDKLATLLNFISDGEDQIRGKVDAETEFFFNDNGQAAAHTIIHPSVINFGDVKLDVQPSDIIYSKDRLLIDHFQVNNSKQHIIVSGVASKSPNDSLSVDLHDIDVEYVLNLVDFHSVEFGGYASGKAVVRNLFNNIQAQARIDVRDFTFEKGRMGTLHANASFEKEEGQINIHAIADDTPEIQTLIDGYVSPKKNYIDLGIQAKGTRLEFMKNFCGSFMDNIQANAYGDCRVVGDLKEINLVGKVVANGKLDITTLNTTYTLRNDTVVAVPDEIIFKNDTVYDKNNNIGVLSGALHHKHLTKMTFDLNVDAYNLLAYDFHDYGDQIFYGSVYGTGSCYMKGRRGEITFDVNANLEKGSFIEYNAAKPEGISDGNFIHWNSPRLVNGRVNPDSGTMLASQETDDTQDNDIPTEIPTDIRMNFIVNTTPDFTLRLLMDENTGDKISLNGSGVIRANYFNKGGFNMYGNYQIDHGIYKLTIQNIIKKDFIFQPGGSIVFGGDPFNAALNLKGQYTVNGVSLSDLQMGRSFTSNNIRINCLMNIGGTAGKPNVTFDMELPTLSSDAAQMVRSVINSEEDLNQQVLYLLAVGRFYPQGSNNAAQEDAAQRNQTSLAMQSILSGTLSQQISNVLSSVVKNNDWTFGANISTGDEGWNNAAYEGMLSGRLLNNRLLINGEFGYRDNVNTQQSNFIGDFDVQYLLLPNGNIAVKVYNQTNDRYFTRNSLTTQGIGIIMKKDFTNLKDLFGKKRKTSIKSLQSTSTSR